MSLCFSSILTVLCNEIHDYAEQGDSDSQYNLALMYDNGYGTPQDYVMAHMHWNIAAANGHEDAKTNMDIVAKEMTPNQIEKAQELAKEWMEKY